MCLGRPQTVSVLFVMWKIEDVFSFISFSVFDWLGSIPTRSHVLVPLCPTRWKLEGLIFCLRVSVCFGNGGR